MHAISFHVYMYAIQLWARAYRDREYHAAVNTNNGTESQNKVLKYSYLPKKKTMTLSNITTILVEEYLPDAHRKYIFQNFQQSSHYRSYNDNIPSFLQGRPRKIILHCLDRKGSSNKFTSEDVDIQQGVFSVHSQKGKVYTVNFGTTSKDNMPYCTCVDWRTHHIPCKHFFAIFQHRESWSWNNLPIEYLESSYISMDSKAIWSHHPSLSDPANDSFPILSNAPTKKPALDFLPKKVRRCDI